MVDFSRSTAVNWIQQMILLNSIKIRLKLYLFSKIELEHLRNESPVRGPKITMLFWIF